MSDWPQRRHHRKQCGPEATMAFYFGCNLRRHALGVIVEQRDCRLFVVKPNIGSGARYGVLLAVELVSCNNLDLLRQVVPERSERDGLLVGYLFDYRTEFAHVSDAQPLR